YGNYLLNSDNINRDAWNLINFQRNKRNKNQNYSGILEAENFITFFTNVADELIAGLPPVDTNSENYLKHVKITHNSSFFFRPVTASEVLGVIKNLKSSGSCDIYGINAKILKDTSPFIANP